MIDRLSEDTDRQVRLARFGTLPARVTPESAVETVATEPPRGRPETAGTEEQRQVFLAGG